VSLKERFSANLKVARRRAGLTQERLALLTELDRTQISYLENAKRMPRLDTLVKLTSALDCRADELIEGMAWKPDLAAFGSYEVTESDGSL
jgi:transcriptional regulator with XRE-family HTH domain